MTQISGTGSGNGSGIGAFAAAMQGAQTKPPSMIATATTGKSAASAPNEGPDTAERAALKQAAKSFEAIFTRQLLGSMRQAGQGEAIGGSSAVDQFRELADADMANDLANKGGLGIAQLILQQLDRKP